MADKYNVRKIDARNVAIGDRSKITDKSEVHVVSPEQSALQAQALQQLHDFIALLPAYEGLIDIKRARAAADEAEAALSKKRLKRGRIERRFTAIMTAIGSVTALAEAINAVQATVAHLLG